MVVSFGGTFEVVVKKVNGCLLLVALLEEAAIRRARHGERHGGGVAWMSLVVWLFVGEN